MKTTHLKSENIIHLLKDSRPQVVYVYNSTSLVALAFIIITTAYIRYYY